MFLLLIIIIIIIISHQLGLHRPVSASSGSFFRVFQAVVVHLVCNSALFLSFCLRSFFLLFVANFICIFLISRQLVLLSTLPKFLHSFVVKNVVSSCSSEKKFTSIHVNRFLSFFKTHISLPYKSLRTVSAKYTLFFNIYGPKLV